MVKPALKKTKRTTHHPEQEQDAPDRFCAYEVSRLTRSRKNVRHMLHQRGWDTKPPSTFESSLATAYIYLNAFRHNSDAERCMTLAARQLSGKRCRTFWCFDEKVGVRTIRAIAATCVDRGVGLAILVAVGAVTSFAAKEIIKSPCGVRFETFRIEETLFDPTSSSLVPHHRIMTATQKEETLERLRTTSSRLPRISLLDPIARYYGAAKGDVFEIHREHPDGHVQISYRAVD